MTQIERESAAFMKLSRSERLRLYAKHNIKLFNSTYVDETDDFDYGDEVPISKLKTILNKCIEQGATHFEITAHQIDGSIDDVGITFVEKRKESDIEYRARLYRCYKAEQKREDLEKQKAAKTTRRPESDQGNTQSSSRIKIRNIETYASNL